MLGSNENSNQPAELMELEAGQDAGEIISALWAKLEPGHLDNFTWFMIVMLVSLLLTLKYTEKYLTLSASFHCADET